MPMINAPYSRSIRCALAASMLATTITSAIPGAPPYPAVAAGVAGAGAAILGALPGLAPGLSDALTFKSSNVWLQEVRFKQKSGGFVPAAAAASGATAANGGGAINGNSPVLVHVVIFYAETSFQAIGGLNADQYFKNIEQLKKDHRATTQFFEYEIPPGVQIPPQYIVRTSESGIACGVFARYSSPGAHRYNVGSDRIIEIELGPNDFTVNTIKA